MRKLSANIAELMAMRTAAASPVDRNEPGRLQDFGPFGSNPGALKAKCHIPAQVASKPALVVVLHRVLVTAVQKVPLSKLLNYLNKSQL